MLHQRDAVGLVTHDTRIRQIIPPKASSKHLLQLLNVLEQTKPGGETGWPRSGTSWPGTRSAGGAWSSSSPTASTSAGLLLALQHFRHRRHEVLLFHVLAPEEIEFPFRKWTQFRNLEVAGHQMLVDPQRLRQGIPRELRGVLQASCATRRRHGRRLPSAAHRRAGGPRLGVYLSARQTSR